MSKDKEASLWFFVGRCDVVLPAIIDLIEKEDFHNAKRKCEELLAYCLKLKENIYHDAKNQDEGAES
jgi:hypothetical protein